MYWLRCKLLLAYFLNHVDWQRIRCKMSFILLSSPAFTKLKLTSPSLLYKKIFCGRIITKERIPPKVSWGFCCYCQSLKKKIFSFIQLTLLPPILEKKVILFCSINAVTANPPTKNEINIFFFLLILLPIPVYWTQAKIIWTWWKFRGWWYIIAGLKTHPNWSKTRKVSFLTLAFSFDRHCRQKQTLLTPKGTNSQIFNSFGSLKL